MTPELLLKKIKEASSEVDGKLMFSCAKAHKMHKELGVSLREIGAACDSHKIRIRNCQLGCFK